MSEQRRYDFSRLEAFLDALPDAAGIPACGVCVMLDHEKVYSHYSGFADKDKKRPASSSDTYWLYSSTKVSTAVSVLQLVERGLLSLSDPLYKYIPEYKEMNVIENGVLRPAKRYITIENLLSMTAGFTYDRNTEALKSVTADPKATTLDVIRAMAKDPLIFDPGENYFYSLAFDVLGALIEVVSGLPLDRYFKENIADPLGMTVTTHKPDSAALENLSEQYRYDFVNRRSIPLRSNTPTYVTDNYFNGGGGLISTVEDYLLLADALANGGVGKSGARILDESSIRDMATSRLVNSAQITAFSSTPCRYGYGYGLGVRVHLHPEYSLAKSPAGEFGWDGAAGHYLLADMENHLAICYAMHVKSCKYGSHVIHPKVRDLTYEALGI